MNVYETLGPPLFPDIKKSNETEGRLHKSHDHTGYMGSFPGCPVLPSSLVLLRLPWQRGKERLGFQYASRS